MRLPSDLARRLNMELQARRLSANQIAIALGDEDTGKNMDQLRAANTASIPLVERPRSGSRRISANLAELETGQVRAARGYALLLNSTLTTSFTASAPSVR